METREHVCVYVCKCVHKRAWRQENMCVYVYNGVCMCAHALYVADQLEGRQRELVCVCEYVCVCVCV